MSTSAPVDVKDLVIRRESADRPSVAPKRRIVSRVVLPALLIVGFAAVLGWAARDAYLPRTPVTVVPVRLSLSEQQAGGTPLFNAAGWVEPRPTPIRVAALASGVVEELLVVEDQAVDEGEPIAQLVKDDAQLALEQARAVLELRESEVQEAQAAVAAAQVNLEIPAHLELPVAESEAALARVVTELSNLPHLRKRAEARLRLAKFDLETRKRLLKSDAVTELDVEEAQAEFDAAQAEVEELTRREPTLIEQRTALKRQVAAAQKLLELKTSEQQAIETARARLLGAQSRLRQAEVAVDEAELRLSRMTIYAPVSGRILNLTTQPGSHVMGSTGVMQGENQSTVVKMYDPHQLQVRVDVRFEDLPKTGRDQVVEIRSPAVAEPLAGRVLFLTGFANIQKNTLEVKVSIEDPPEVIKPEMLVDVTFLAPETTIEADESADQFRLFVPRELVQEEGESAFVWVADVGEQIARRVRVLLGTVQTPQFVEVTDGLTPASRLIATGREQLQEGDRIQITGEDAAGTGGPVAVPTSENATPSRFPGSSTR